jgi:hypothetical protein
MVPDKSANSIEPACAREATPAPNAKRQQITAATFTRASCIRNPQISILLFNRRNHDFEGE